MWQFLSGVQEKTFWYYIVNKNQNRDIFLNPDMTDDTNKQTNKQTNKHVFSTHWVVVPTSVIPGKPLPVTVSFFNTTEDVQVRVDLIKDGHHLVTTNEQAFQKGNSNCA